MHKELVLPATFTALEQLDGFLDHLPTTHDAHLQTQLKLALHELCMNIIQHGYAGRAGEIQISATHRTDQLILTIRDTAPNTYSRANQAPPQPEDLPESGWGMYIVTQVMDELQYKSLHNGNQWRLVKKL